MSSSSSSYSKGTIKSKIDPVVGKLFDAARNGNYLAFIQDAEKNMKVLNERNFEDHTLLYFAARNNAVDIVRFILENGIDPNEFSGPKKSTALHAASFYNLPEVAKLLLKHGAKFDIKNAFLRTALQEASKDVNPLFVIHVLKEKKKNQASCVIELPYILQSILEFLPLQDLVNCMTVSSLFFYATNEQSLWKNFAERNWPVRANVKFYDGDWKDLCLNNNARNADVELICEPCKISIAGIACAGMNRGNNDKKFLECKNNLYLSSKSTLSCPYSHGSLKIPYCTQGHALKPILRFGNASASFVSNDFHECEYDPGPETRKDCEGKEIILNQGLTHKHSITRFFSSNFEGGPVFNCSTCKWGIYGIVCTTSEQCRESGGKPLRREGFYERVWCAYVWNCMNDCSIKIGRSNFECSCSEGFMHIHEFEQAFGPPMN
eukprot:TRINITY_DN2033_c0_g1_i2.p1 TRINITY_DN2033_c0_g1~~TRINITY_DN2033_c0_g1_i2.p1  ORF type:complete len:435 (+),score=72.84 TRINITY_DN2033_c0_g1_i2:313-1617(+)